MISRIDAIKAVIREHDLRYIVITDMDGRKQDQESGSVDRLCGALDRVGALLANEAYKVEAWKTGDGDSGHTMKGGKRSKLAQHFQWTVPPERTSVVPVASVDHAPIVAAIQGLRDELAADEDDEPEAEPVPPPQAPWVEPAIQRAFALVDALIIRLGIAPAAAPMTGIPPGAADVDDGELLRAVLRAKKDPANAAIAKQLIAMYGDAAAKKAEGDGK